MQELEVYILITVLILYHPSIILGCFPRIKHNHVNFASVIISPKKFIKPKLV